MQLWQLQTLERQGRRKRRRRVFLEAFVHCTLYVGKKGDQNATC
jgi:hypothetical protein